ncbi:MAG: hypothetical protein AABX75_00735 [Nanoarchaeota archaeon]
MKRELKIKDALDAQQATKRHLEHTYSNKLKDVRFQKVWFCGGNTQDTWDVEGSVKLVKFIVPEKNILNCKLII